MEIFKVILAENLSRQFARLSPRCVEKQGLFALNISEGTSVNNIGLQRNHCYCVINGLETRELLLETEYTAIKKKDKFEDFIGKLMLLETVWVIK